MVDGVISERNEFLFMRVQNFCAYPAALFDILIAHTFLYVPLKSRPQIGCHKQVSRGNRDWRNVRNKELNDLYSSLNIVRVIKSRMRGAGQVARTGKGFGGDTWGKETAWKT